MAKPFDVSKFRRDLTKSITGMSAGFNDPTDWISTGSYALNPVSYTHLTLPTKA